MKMTTAEALEKIGATGYGYDIDELLKRAAWDVQNEKPKRLGQCHATTYGRRTLKSYDTVTAIRFGNYVVQFDTYSRTSSNQARKFANEIGASVITLTDLVKYADEKGLKLPEFIYCRFWWY